MSAAASCDVAPETTPPKKLKTEMTASVQKNKSQHTRGSPVMPAAAGCDVAPERTKKIILKQR